MNNKLRYAIVMVIGVLMNQVFYTLADILNIPVWLDVCGTAFAAFALEPTAGLLVGLINNFYLALFAYDRTTLIYYSISAAVALIAGVCLKKNGKFERRRVIPAIVLVTLTSTILSVLLAIWRTNGIPDVGWEHQAYLMAASMGMPKLLASFCGTLFIKTLDTLASAGLVAGVYAILPKQLKYAPKLVLEKKKGGAAF